MNTELLGDIVDSLRPADCFQCDFGLELAVEGLAVLFTQKPAPFFGQATILNYCPRSGVHYTDEQIMKMKPMHSEMQKKQARFKADLKIAQIELADIMEVKDFDLEKASSAVKKIEEIKTSHHLEMLNAMKEMRTIMSAEQFKKMNKMMMSMKMGEKKPTKKMMMKK